MKFHYKPLILCCQMADKRMILTKPSHRGYMPHCSSGACMSGPIYFYFGFLEKLLALIKVGLLEACLQIFVPFLCNQTGGKSRRKNKVRTYSFFTQFIIIIFSYLNNHKFYFILHFFLNFFPFNFSLSKYSVNYLFLKCWHYDKKFRTKCTISLFVHNYWVKKKKNHIPRSASAII